ncbi:bifunctional diaminohydroxyphosphoribosylaminopyrimidine deaminase/5-amino-6-(5-phosphoribosylamino)uracil reductase RibD [Sulfurovum sp. zt1-1]|uniref:Riboflavin biosynthesis protein RibD n=1 Tax=Sulfurovum zhangzhouensis TaxID=3019067 RepID=A0ABT7QWT3_9BACT|nr:bifunctional diaminohydroxyphosphoribosylaminopyrimidine deaminase/5-amino-6-(5-phosphoribosylamino)uracil reductase RibD [Sulfurovum zhangzhouensis]MDM5271289.1 bifunctional diaminohydroxyphosphoribosylaminopyrimidine deaminase/5-amino-6-(5-phosphoribosylamino)uracil reductase RibD [Sulfurovum zhangzhouensis]
MQFDEFYMQLALNEAWKYQGLTYPNPAVGAVMVENGKLLSIAAHQKAGTSHAEVLALIAAYETLSGEKIEFDPLNSEESHDFLLKLPPKFFASCTIYVTLEPCAHHGKTPSCASLLSRLKLQRVVIATCDPIKGHDGGMNLLQNVTFGILREKAEILLEPFKIWQKRAFVLFKLAQTSNGRIGGGYLSSKASLSHVHQLRERCDILFIGGNTVREDRPTLDCRFTEGNAPNVKIYSHTSDFDSEIPLFKVQDRKVEITDDLSFLDQPSFVLVEGGEGMLQSLQKKIDWLLIYQTPKLSTNALSYNIEMNLDFLHTERMGVDMMIWSKQVGY